MYRSNKKQFSKLVSEGKLTDLEATKQIKAGLLLACKITAIIVVICLGIILAVSLNSST
jgi:hypothetical protein